MEISNNNFGIKIFLCQLLQTEHKNGQYTILIGKKSIDFCMIWIQGHIIKVIDNSSIILSDGTGCIKVDSWNQVANGCSKAVIGLYIAVLGTLEESINDAFSSKDSNNSLLGRRSVKAIKISNLSESYLNEIAWPAEVILCQKMLIARL